MMQIVVLPLLAMLLTVQAAAPAPPLQPLGRPASAKNILGGLLVTDRRTGENMLVLSNNNEASGLELIFANVKTGSARTFRAPAGAGAVALKEIPGDRLIVGTFYDGAVMIFDLKKMEFTKTIMLPGEKYVYSLAIGGDGRVYIGTYPGGKLFALSLDTYALEDLGAPAPPNTYLYSITPTPDGRLLCNFMVAKPTRLLYDPSSKRFDAVPPQLKYALRVATWNGYLLGGNLAFQGRDLHPVIPPPFPVPPSQMGHWEVDTYQTSPQVLYLKQGSAFWRYKQGDEKLTLLTTADLRGGRLLGATEDGRVVGSRGEDYFVITPGGASLQLHKISTEGAPRKIMFLRVAPDGRIWGGPPYGQTLFWMNPKTKEVVNTPALSDHGGEIYDVAFLNGIIYAVAYSGAEVIQYDPRQSWDQWNGKNPRTIASLLSRGYTRPTGGVIVGPGRKLYSGWEMQIGKNGGAIAVTDATSGATDLIENPLGEQEIVGIVTDGKVLYAGSGIGGSNLPVAPGTYANFGIFDPSTRQIVWKQVITGSRHARPLGYDQKTGIVPVAVDNVLRLFDTSTRTFHELPTDAPLVGSYMNAVDGAGTFYYGSNKKVVAVDLASRTFKTVEEAPAAIGNIARAPDGTLYIATGADLYTLPAANR